MDRVLRLSKTAYASRADASVVDLDYTQDFTIQALIWKDPNSLSTTFADIIRKAPDGIAYYNGAPGWRIGFEYHIFYRWWNNYIDFAVRDGTNGSAVALQADPGWIYATGTWDATTKTLKLYVNDRTATTTNALIVPANIKNTQPLTIGKGNMNNNVMMARIWNRKISDVEYTTLYNTWLSTRNPARPSGFSATALLSEYLMDGEVAANGSAGTGYLKDDIGSNHLQLLNGATVEFQTGTIRAISPVSGNDIGPSEFLKAGGTSSSGAEQYQFEIGESSNLVTNNRLSNWIPIFGQWQPILKPNTAYWWRVRGKNSDWSAIQHFETRPSKNWYVRPLAIAGTYGLENGSSYANAFNGLTQIHKIATDWTDTRGIKWGSDGVESGDTLYICGVHLPNKNDPDSETVGHDYNVFIPISGYSDEFPVTIRGDYSLDPGLIWGFHESPTSPTWNGPDGNNVYYTADNVNSSYGLFESISGTTGTRLLQASGTNITTWTTPSGPSWHFNNSNNRTYVKMSDGGSPVNRIWQSIGYALNFQKQKYLIFKNLEIRGVSGFIDPITTRLSEPADAFEASSHITWDGCVLRYGVRMIQPYYQNDNWKMNQCILEYAASGVYGIAGVPNVDYPGPNFMTITNCSIKHIGELDYPDIDGHAIGTQASNDWIVTDNVTDYTGSSIVFWTSGYGQARNKILRNTISNVTGSGDGISLGGPSSGINGLSTGNEISDNHVTTCSLSGISSTCVDTVKIYRNRIDSCARGFDFEPVNNTLKNDLQDNIVTNCSDYFIYMLSQGFTQFSQKNDAFGPDPDTGLKFYKHGATFNLTGYKTNMGFSTLQSWPLPQITGSQSVITLVANSNKHITLDPCSRLSIRPDDADVEINVPLLHGTDYMRVIQGQEQILRTTGNGIKEINLRNGGTVTVAIIGKAGR